MLLAGSATPGWRAVRKEDLEAVESALLRLQARHREVIILRFLCEFEHEEAAELLGFRSPSHARMAASRAIAALRKELGTQPDG